VKILSKDPIVKLTVTKLCQIFKVKRDTYYKYFKYKSQKRILENMDKEKAILEVFEKNNKVYGVEKIKQALDRNGYKISRQKIRKIQTKLGLFPFYFKPKYTSSKNEKRINLLNRNFYAEYPNEKWSADITYIWVESKGWCYLASVMDLCTRKIVGWRFSEKAEAKIVVEALEDALYSQQPSKGLIIHTDQGSQYTSATPLSKPAQR